METVFTTNMKCNSCLSKVRPILDSEPTIESWEADLADSRKILRVELRDDGQTSVIIDRLAEQGFTASIVNDQPSTSTAVISPGVPTTTDQPKASKETFRISTYKPLLLVLTYVLGATFFAESLHGALDWMRAMSYFMGFFFLGFAFFKLLNIAGFADAFATYDIVARRSRFYALLYPWIEVALGVLFLSQTLPLVANCATAAIMAIGLVGVIAAVRRKQAIQCACLGTAFNLPMSVVTIIENSTMIAMAVVMLVASMSTI